MYIFIFLNTKNVYFNKSINIQIYKIRYYYIYSYYIISYKNTNIVLLITIFIHLDKYSK